MYGTFDNWTRQHPGYYTDDSGAEIVKTGPATWTLSHPYQDEESRHRSLRKAIAYADNYGWRDA